MGTGMKGKRERRGCRLQSRDSMRRIGGGMKRIRTYNEGA